MIKGPAKLWVVACSDGDWSPHNCKYDAVKFMKLERKRWPDLKFKVLSYEPTQLCSKEQEK